MHVIVIDYLAVDLVASDCMHDQTLHLLYSVLLPHAVIALTASVIQIYYL